MRIGAVLAEAGDRAIDEPRIDRAQAFVVEAVALQPADLEVLDQHVGVRREPPDERAPFLRLEIGGDRALAAIAGVEVGGREVAAVAASTKGGPQPRVSSPLPGRSTFTTSAPRSARSLPGPRTGEDAGELENAQTFKWHRHEKHLKSGG